jgi:hypothetical protein
MYSTEPIPLPVSSRRRHAQVGKVMFGLACALLLGLSMISDDRENTALAESITLEEYIGKFDAYREELVAAVMSPAGNIIGAVIFVGGFLLLYELAGAASAALLARLTPSAPPREPDDAHTWYEQR